MKKYSYFYALTYMFLPLMALLVFTLIISALTGEPFSTAGYVALTVLTAVIVIIDVALLKDKTVGHCNVDSDIRIDSFRQLRNGHCSTRYVSASAGTSADGAQAVSEEYLDQHRLSFHVQRHCNESA